MNIFVTVTCFALVATVAANPGYNYNQPRPVANYAPQQQYSQQQQVAAPSQLYSQPAPQQAQASQYFASTQQSAGHAPSFAAGPSGAGSAQYNQQSQQQVVITKDIYIHSAHDEHEEINSEVGGGAGGPIRKNYRIVFIKAPAHNIKFNVASQNSIQAANEEKTVIYVLTKKPEIIKTQNQVNSAQPEAQTHKPEVYFIKYNTQEEANRAQQEIRAQYDALGGATHVSDEGFAPVSSVIGGGGSGSANLGSASGNIQSFSGGSNFAQAASNNQQQFAQSSFQGGQGSASSASFAVQTPGNEYLPARRK